MLGSNQVNYARISSSRPNTPINSYAGPNSDNIYLNHTIFSSSKLTLLSFFDTKTVLPLRSVCKEFNIGIAEQPWRDTKTKITNKKRVKDWKKCFPNARALNADRDGIYTIDQLVDEDFVHFTNLEWLNISHNLSFGDIAFTYLTNIHTLIMINCNQERITDKAFSNLPYIHTLIMDTCDQNTLTDIAFSNLGSLRVLSMNYCIQCRITNNAFSYLKNLTTLHIDGCIQNSITREIFKHLNRIETISMKYVNYNNKW